MRVSRNIELVAIALLYGLGVLLARRPATQPAILGSRRDALPPARSPAHGDNIRPPPAIEARRSPADIPARGWWDVAKRVVEQFNDHRLMYEAGSVVFFVLLSIFPALAAMVSLYGLFTDPKTIADHLASAASVLPGGSMDLLKNQLIRVASNSSRQLSLGLVVGFAVSLWSANQGMKSLFDVLNVAYDEKEKRSYIRLTLITLGFTLGTLVFTIVAIGGVVVLPAVLQFVYLGAETDMLVRVLRWPVLLVVITLYLSVIYRYGPSREHARWQWVTWGGALASILWLLISFAFSTYVSDFGTYNQTYGSLGAVVGFMTWIWLSAMVVLLGAELNAELEHQTALETMPGEARAGARD